MNRQIPVYRPLNSSEDVISIFLAGAIVGAAALSAPASAPGVIC